MDKLFFDNWDSIFRTFIITILAYFSLIALLRISGKRTLSKMNAFDLIVTVAIGSVLATVLLNKSIALADGVLAFALLIGLQYLITTLALRSKRVSQWVKATPSLIVYNGEILTETMHKERISEDEVYAALRQNGVSSIVHAKAVVLEPDGSLSIISSVDAETLETIRTVDTSSKS